MLKEKKDRAMLGEKNNNECSVGKTIIQCTKYLRKKKTHNIKLEMSWLSKKYLNKKEKEKGRKRGSEGGRKRGKKERKREERRKEPI